MDVTQVAGALVMGRDQAAVRDVQVALLQKAIESQSGIAAKLLAPMALPLATEGRIGTNVNAYL